MKISGIRTLFYLIVRLNSFSFFSHFHILSFSQLNIAGKRGAYVGSAEYTCTIWFSVQQCVAQCNYSRQHCTVSAHFMCIHFLSALDLSTAVCGCSSILLGFNCRDQSLFSYLKPKYLRIIESQLFSLLEINN